MLSIVEKRGVYLIVAAGLLLVSLVAVVAAGAESGLLSSAGQTEIILVLTFDQPVDEGALRSFLVDRGASPVVQRVGPAEERTFQIRTAHVVPGERGWARRLIIWTGPMNCREMPSRAGPRVALIRTAPSATPKVTLALTPSRNRRRSSIRGPSMTTELSPERTTDPVTLVPYTSTSTPCPTATRSPGPLDSPDAAGSEPAGAAVPAADDPDTDVPPYRWSRRSGST